MFGSEFFLFHPQRIRNTQPQDRPMLNTFVSAAARSGRRYARSQLKQDDTEKGRIYVEPAVVLDEAQFSEFVHEKINA